MCRARGLRGGRFGFLAERELLFLCTIPFVTLDFYFYAPDMSVSVILSPVFEIILVERSRHSLLMLHDLNV